MEQESATCACWKSGQINQILNTKSYDRLKKEVIFEVILVKRNDILIIKWSKSDACVENYFDAHAGAGLQFVPVQPIKSSSWKWK